MFWEWSTHDTSSYSAFYSQSILETAAFAEVFSRKGAKAQRKKIIFAAPLRRCTSNSWSRFFQIDRLSISASSHYSHKHSSKRSSHSQLIRDFFQCKPLLCRAFRHETVTLRLVAHKLSR